MSADIVNFPGKPIAEMVADALAETELPREPIRISRKAKLAYDLYLLREDAVTDLWLRGPMSVSVTDPCPLCDLLITDTWAKGWWARNSADEYLVGHCYCVNKALQYGTPPGDSKKFDEAGARLYVLPVEFITGKKR